MSNPTDYVVLGTIILLLLWETWTLTNNHPKDTVSETVWRAMAKQPLVPFLLGMLMGHFVWIPSECWTLVGGQ